MSSRYIIVERPVILRLRYVRSNFKTGKTYPHYALTVPREIVEGMRIRPGTRFRAYGDPKEGTICFVKMEPVPPV